MYGGHGSKELLLLPSVVIIIDVISCIYYLFPGSCYSIGIENIFSKVIVLVFDYIYT